VEEEEMDDNECPVVVTCSVLAEHLQQRGVMAQYNKGDCHSLDTRLHQQVVLVDNVAQVE
jgi:hypothetical protein